MMAAASAPLYIEYGIEQRRTTRNKVIFMDDSVSTRPISFSGHCKVVVSDVDGTFLQDDKQVSSGVMAAVRELQDRGIPFLFASGRMFGAIADWVRDLKLTAPQIVNNGAEIVQPDGTPLSQCCLSHEAVLWLIEEGRKAGFEPVLFTQGDHIYSDARHFRRPP